MELFQVLQHVATPCQEPFTGSDIRRVVWQTADKAEAEQYADVANLTRNAAWIKCYSVRSTMIFLDDNEPSYLRRVVPIDVGDPLFV